MRYAKCLEIKGREMGLCCYGDQLAFIVFWFLFTLECECFQVILKLLLYVIRVLVFFKAFFMYIFEAFLFWPMQNHKICDILCFCISRKAAH